MNVWHIMNYCTCDVPAGEGHRVEQTLDRLGMSIYHGGNTRRQAVGNVNPCYHVTPKICSNVTLVEKYPLIPCIAKSTNPHKYSLYRCGNMRTHVDREC